MIRRIFCIAAVALGTLNANVYAQTTRVAFVDIDRITEKSDKINSALDKARGRADEIQAEIEVKMKRIQELRAEVKKGEGVLAESELKKKRDEATKLEKDVIELEKEGQKEVTELKQTLFDPMVRSISQAIEEVAKEKSIDLVVKSEAIVYGANIADISDDVVKKLNSKSGSTESSSSSSSKSEGSTSSKSTTDNTKSESSSSKEETSSKSNSSETKPAGEGAAAEGATRNPLFPSVPLVTRPVDRQSE